MHIDLHSERSKLKNGETLCYVTPSNGGYIIGTVDAMSSQSIVVTVIELIELKKLIDAKFKNN